MSIETINGSIDLARQTPALPEVTGGDLPGLAVLQQWADANDQAARLVAQWVWTDLVPLHHWPNPAGMTLKTWPNPRLSPNGESDQEYRRRAEIATASAAGTVLRGISLGLSPNIALEQMFSIHGKIGMMTKLKYALAIKHGVKVWDVELTPQSVTCAGIHPLTGDTVEITITLDQAVKAEWVQDNKAYVKTPIDMLWARAMSRVLDRVAGHVLFGLASIEDIEPEEREPVRPGSTVTAADIQARTTTPKRPATVETPTAQAEAPEGTPDDVAPVAPPADVSGAVELISPAQIKKVQATFTGMGVKNIDLRRDVVAHLAGHPVDSLKDVTRAEATHMIDRLEQASQAENPQGVLAEWLATADQLAEQAAAEQDGDQLPVDGAEAEADRG